MSRLPEVNQTYAIINQVARSAEVEEYLAAETVKALGAHSSWALKLVRALLFLPLRRLAKMAVDFDQRVAGEGLHAAAAQTLSSFFTNLEVQGQEQLPLEGPLLIAANHPGTFDSLAILANLPRKDVAVVLAANPFFRTFHHARKHFIYSTLDPYARMAVVRAAVRHLRSGGALIIFATGKLDPDPAYYYTNACQSIELWSPSLAYMLSKAPQTRLTPVVAGNFVARSWINSPLTRMRHAPADRQRLAEFLQVIQQLALGKKFVQTPRILFGEAFTLCGQQRSDPVQDMQAIRLAALRALQAGFSSSA